MVDILTAALCALNTHPKQPTEAVKSFAFLRAIAGLAVLVAVFGSLSQAGGTCIGIEEALTPSGARDLLPTGRP